MSNEITSALKDVGLNANLRPNSLDIRGQQPNLFPSDAFEFDDPNRTDEPVLSMKSPWSIDIGEINFSSLDSETQGLIEGASIIAEANSLSIQNNSGEINLQADVINIIATELNLEGDTINITADKIIIYNPSDDDETEQLSEVLKIEGGDIYFGAYNPLVPEDGAGMKWDQDAGTLIIQGSLEGVDGTFSGDLEGASGTFSGDLSADTIGFGQLTLASDYVSFTTSGSSTAYKIQDLPSTRGYKSFTGAGYKYVGGEMVAFYYGVPLTFHSDSSTITSGLGIVRTIIYDEDPPPIGSTVGMFTYTHELYYNDGGIADGGVSEPLFMYMYNYPEV